MITQIYQWKCTLLSTSPLRIGDDEEDVILDQFDRPFIPGTSIAGACRAFVQTICSEEEVNELFGTQNNRAKDTVLIFSDGKSYDKHMSEVRTGIRIDGATNTTKSGALFQRQMLAPGATFDMTITLKTTTEQHGHYANIVEKMLQAIHSGVIRFGAFKSTGSGKLTIKSCKVVHYDCTKEDDLLAYVERSKPYVNVSFQDDVENDRLVQINLRGKTETPLFIGGQYPNDSNEPDETYMTTVDGKPLIPGSTLKGVLRHRVQRIANVLDLKEKEKYIAYLFGSDEAKSELGTGFLRLEDVILTEEKTKIYYRIAINPFTGGTKDGALLEEETVLGSFETTLHFQQKAKDTNVSLALLLFALRDLAMQKVTIGSGAAIGRGFFAIEQITLKEGEKEVVFHIDTKRVSGDDEWLQQLQQSLESAQQ